MQTLPAWAWSQAAWGVLAGFSLVLTPVTAAIAQTSITAAADTTGTTVGYDAATQTYTINGGTQINANLFHSFQQLGLTTGEIANFWVNPDVANVLTRVTGGQASVIDGLLQVRGGNHPNLFVLNPAGVLLSPNARLNLAGSFSVSTASGLAFGDGVFNAIGGNDYSALVGDPSGYVFLGNEGVLLNEADLVVNPGESITLAGNTVVNTGTLDASEGTVSIVAVPEAGLIQISQTGLILSLAIPTDQLQGRVNTGITPLDLPELLAGEWNGEATTVKTLADGTVVLNSGDPANADPGAITATGTVDVSGRNGGQVVFWGEDIALPAGLIDISGTVGGELGVYAQDELTLGTEVNAAGGGHALFDPVTFTVGAAEAATLVSTLAGGDATVEAAETINVNGAIDSSSQQRRNTLTFQDENRDNNLTINLNALITLGRRQTLTGQGTTINVNVTDPGIVQNAVALAATGATVNLGAGTYQEGAEVRLSRDIILTGAGAGNTQLDGNTAHRVLRVNRGVTAQLNDLTLTQGQSRLGGGIYNQGTLILNGSAISNNRSTRNGGGIHNNNGEVTLINSELTDNRANRDGGGIFANRGTLTLDNSSVSGNQAGRDGGGIRSNNAVLTVDGSTISNNQARFGGGLYTNRGTLTLDNSQISNNQANRDGGGIRSNRSLLTVNQSQISGNQANRDGGALRSNGNTVTLNRVEISGNSAGRNGGGVYANQTTLTFDSSTVASNEAQLGGGIYNNRGTVTAINSTLSGNDADRSGGGAYSNRGRVTLNNSTISNNQSDRGGGIYSNRATLTLNNTLVAGNSALSQGNEVARFRGTVTSNHTLFGFSGDAGLSGMTANLANGDLVPTVPLSQILSPLASNGGPTQTHALVVGSPALDAGDNTATTADQRGIAAIGPRDIGAFEGTIAPDEASFENTFFVSLEPLDEGEGVACQTLDLTPELRETLGLVSALSSQQTEIDFAQTTAALRAGASPECPGSAELLEPGD
jgi:filamentous hemagglutinin family protein